VTRRSVAIMAALLLSGLALSPGAGAGDTGTGVRGVLLDATCPGPCTCPPCGPGMVCPEGAAPRAGIPCAAPRRGAAGHEGSVERGARSIPPTPYSGDGARVVVRRASDGKVVAHRAPAGGRFQIRLEPGRYRVHGYVALSCWSGETVPVTVVSGSFARVRIYLRNQCVLGPQQARAAVHR